MPAPHPLRRPPRGHGRVRGFTLVELMVVVAIIGISAAFAVMGTRSRTGEQLPAFGRASLSLAHEARQAAVSLSRTTRLRIVPGSPVATLTTEQQDPLDPTRWIPIGGLLRAPSGVEVLAVQSGVTAAAPSSVATAVTSICFSRQGRVGLSNDDTCPTGQNAMTGASVFFRAATGRGRYALRLYGLTGLPRLVDRW